MSVQDEAHAWLRSPVARIVSDVLLGGLLAAAGCAALAGVPDAHPFAQPERMGPWAFPAAIAYALLAVGGILILRGGLLRPREPGRWSAVIILAIVPAVIVAILLAREWSTSFMLTFGPADFAAMYILVVAISIAVVRGSVLRTVGMALLGLLLATIGVELSGGLERFTFGIPDLADGISLPVAAYGLVVMADGLVGLASPSLLLATYTRQIAGASRPSISTAAGLGLRLLSALAVAASVYAAFLLNNSMLDVWLLLAFAVLGIACKLLDWSRLVPVLAFALAPMIEEHIRRALLISRGDFGTFAHRTLSLSMLLLVCGLLAAAAALSLLHSRKQRRAAA